MNKVPPLKLTAIPATRKVRSDTDLRQFVLADTRNIEQAAAQWVQQVANDALNEAIAAGNPREFAIEIDRPQSKGRR